MSRYLSRGQGESQQKTRPCDRVFLNSCRSERRSGGSGSLVEFLADGERIARKLGLVGLE